MDYNKYKNQYKLNLLENVVPFWVQNSPDREFGGFFTCLDRQGKVYDTDKFIWLQCRQVWLFSMLYTEVEKKQEWLDLAIMGAEFLKKNGHDKEGNWYFSLSRDGKPLTQPFNIFSDCFAAMAFARLSKATGNKGYAKLADETFRNILRRRDNPKGVYNKTYPGTRPMKSFAIPMILSNLVLEVEHIIEPELVEEIISYAIHEVMNVFYREDTGVILENVALDGSALDTFDGRLIDPGHGLESMWFLMDLASRKSDHKLIQKAVDISLDLLDYGWDKKYGGIFYFMDIKGNPPDKLEWDQKLWWVHQESILAMLKGFMNTGNKRCWDWFEKLHDYSWAHFADKEYGEWFGYLNRQGEVLLPLKGGKWKGCFHTPRFMYQAWKTLEIIEKHNG
jgi:N-acylglucosamine 2-epimerase